MVFKLLKRRWHKISVISLFVISALILILALFVNRYWSPILEKKLRDIVIKSSDSLYRADFSSAELHVLRGTIVINNIVLKPDTAVYNRRRKQHLAPNNLVQLRVKQLTLSHIHPFKLYFQQKVEIGEIALKQPELNVSYQLNHTKDTVLKDNRTAWQKISKSLISIHIDRIRLGDVKFRYEDYSGNKVAVSELKQMNLSAYDLLIDSATQTDKSRLLYCRDIVAEVNDYTAKTADGLYRYQIKSIKLSTFKSQLNVTGLTLNPLKADAFFEKSPNERYTLRIDSCQLNNFDFLSYHKYRILTATHMTMSGGALNVFANPTYHQDGTDKIKSFPNVALFKINADMRIDTISIKQLNVSYTEYNTKSHETGTISFNNTSAQALNIVTRKTALQKNSTCSVKFTSYFMNRGKLDASFLFSLLDDNHSFSYKGILGPMNLQAANPAIKPFAMVKIVTGTLKQMTFNIHADRQKATGNVQVLYNNLKINILKADTISDALKKRTIASLYANLYIIKHNNPDNPADSPRSFNVDYERTAETPFFKFMWQTLLTGIKPCAGLDKKTQDATAELVKQQALKKEERKVKKQIRIERRAERRMKRAEKEAN